MILGTVRQIGKVLLTSIGIVLAIPIGLVVASIGGTRGATLLVRSSEYCWTKVWGPLPCDA